MSETQKGQAIAVGVNSKQRIEVSLFNGDAEELAYIDMSANAAKEIAYDLISSVFNVLSDDDKQLFANYLESVAKENR